MVQGCCLRTYVGRYVGRLGGVDGYWYSLCTTMLKHFGVSRQFSRQFGVSRQVLRNLMCRRVSRQFSRNLVSRRLRGGFTPPPPPMQTLFLKVLRRLLYTNLVCSSTAVLLQDAISILSRTLHSPVIVAITRTHKKSCEV